MQHTDDDARSENGYGLRKFHDFPCSFAEFEKPETRNQNNVSTSPSATHGDACKKMREKTE